MLAPFECLCGNFILPEPASYIFFYALFNLRNLLYIITPSSVKNILYGKSQNPKLLTIKLLCDGLGITLGEFFSTPEFDALEQEIQ